MMKSNDAKPSVLNVPNQLTIARLVLSVVLFYCIAWEWYLASLVLFIIAAGTDWLDGYLARKLGQTTTLGRVLDPLADKVIICGTFIFLIAVPAMREVPWGLRAWMVVVVVARELMVTVLRSLIEGRGGNFSATMPGKLKMLLQCIAAGACLFYLSYTEAIANAPTWCWVVLVVSVYTAVVSTVYSGVIYVFAAAKLLRE